MLLDPDTGQPSDLAPPPSVDKILAFLEDLGAGNLATPEPVIPQIGTAGLAADRFADSLQFGLMRYGMAPPSDEVLDAMTRMDLHAAEIREFTQWLVRWNETAQRMEVLTPLESLIEDRGSPDLLESISVGDQARSDGGLEAIQQEAFERGRQAALADLANDPRRGESIFLGSSASASEDAAIAEAAESQAGLADTLQALNRLLWTGNYGLGTAAAIGWLSGPGGGGGGLASFGTTPPMAAAAQSMSAGGISPGALPFGGMAPASMSLDPVTGAQLEMASDGAAAGGMGFPDPGSPFGAAGPGIGQGNPTMVWRGTAEDAGGYQSMGADNLGGDGVQGAGPMLPGAASPIVVRPEMGMMTLMAPPVQVASADSARAGAAVSFGWPTLVQGVSVLDESSMQRLAQSLPPSASLVYPAVTSSSLGSGATNLPVSAGLLTSLLRQSYGDDSSAVADRAASMAQGSSPASSGALPLSASIVPTTRPMGAATGILGPGQGAGATGALSQAGAGQAQSGGALSFLGMPVRLAPSLGASTDLKDEVKVRQAADQSGSPALTKPENFGLLRDKLFPKFQTVHAEPDKTAWNRAAPSFGLKSGDPMAVLSPDARVKPVSESAPKPQMEAGPNALSTDPVLGSPAHRATVGGAPAGPGSQTSRAPGSGVPESPVGRTYGGRIPTAPSQPPGSAGVPGVEAGRAVGQPAPGAGASRLPGGAAVPSARVGESPASGALGARTPGVTQVGGLPGRDGAPGTPAGRTFGGQIPPPGPQAARLPGGSADRQAAEGRHSASPASPGSPGAQPSAGVPTPPSALGAQSGTAVTGHPQAGQAGSQLPGLGERPLIPAGSPMDRIVRSPMGAPTSPLPGRGASGPGAATGRGGEALAEVHRGPPGGVPGAASSGIARAPQPLPLGSERRVGVGGSIGADREPFQTAGTRAPLTQSSDRMPDLGRTPGSVRIPDSTAKTAGSGPRTPFGAPAPLVHATPSFPSGIQSGSLGTGSALGPGGGVRSPSGLRPIETGQPASFPSSASPGIGPFARNVVASSPSPTLGRPPAPIGPRQIGPTRSGISQSGPVRIGSRGFPGHTPGPLGLGTIGRTPGDSRPITGSVGLEGAQRQGPVSIGMTPRVPFGSAGLPSMNTPSIPGVAGADRLTIREASTGSHGLRTTPISLSPNVLFTGMGKPEGESAPPALHLDSALAAPNVGRPLNLPSVTGPATSISRRTSAPLAPKQPSLRPAPAMPLRTPVAKGPGTLVQRAAIGSSHAGGAGSQPAGPAKSSATEGKSRGERTGAEVNVLANTVWSILKRRISAEAERLGQR